MLVKDEFIRKAKITNIVDGDTIDGIVDLGYRVWTTQRFRLLDVNTPERGKLGAKEATQFIKDKLLDKEVFIQSEKDDSFGRWLATVFINDTTINLELLENGHAIPYEK